ncbi:MAG: hypothetical protein ABI577_10450 [bacterium]
MTKYIALLLGVLLAATTLACGDDEDDPTPTAPAATTAAVAPSPTKAAEGGPTNIAVVDAAIKAALAGDTVALTALTRPQTLTCQMNPSGPIPAKPKCLGTQAEGATVQAVLIASGSGGWRQASELPEVWPNWLGPSRELYAVKKLDKADELSGALYHVVFVRPDKMGTSLRISADGIVGIGFDPSFNPRQQADGPTGTFIIPPK